MVCEDELREFLFARLDSLCLAKGLSRNALAQAIEMSAEQLAMIETGAAPLMAAPLWRIAQALGVSIDDLLPPAPKRAARTRATREARAFGASRAEG